MHLRSHSGCRNLYSRLLYQEGWPCVEVAGVALFSVSSPACWVRVLSQNCPSIEGPPQTFPISWCPGVVDFGQRLGLRPDGAGLWREALPPLCPGEGGAAPGRLAGLCVFYWPKISTSCSPLIIHRSCFLSPQYLGCFPASPPTGESPLQNSQARSRSMGLLQIAGFAVQSRSL